MTDLDLKIEIAKIKFSGTHDVHGYKESGFCGVIPIDCVGKLTEFDPLDNAINVELRDEYEVTVDYHHRMVFIFGDKGRVYRFDDDKTKINRAVCECILESVK